MNHSDTLRRSVCTAFLFLSAVVAKSSSAQQPPDLKACRENRGDLRAALADIQKRQRNIGLSGLVMLKGETILSEQLGYADLEHKVAVTPATRFGVASITKAFTGLALLKLNERGLIALDSPIQRYVASFPVKPGSPITPRLLAAHLAGIRHWSNERTPALYARHFDDVNEILELFKNDTLVAPPGTKASYSSYGYDLLGAAIQSSSGMKYESFVVREIITPLGLKNTGFDDVRRVLPNRAMRYSYFHPWTFAVDSNEVYRVPDWDYSHNMAAGNMYATAEDLARLGRAVMQPGFLSARSIELLSKRPRSGNVEADMSFGFFVGDSTSKHRILTIGGSNAGLQSGLHVYPDQDLVIVVLANTWGIGARSGEMNSTLLERLAAICMGWPEPPPVR